MVFSSIEFIFRFLPIFLICYYITPKNYRNFTILMGSLIFYAFGEPIYVLLMIASIIVNHFFALKIARSQHLGGSGKLPLILAVVYDFAVLFIFKYFNFAISIVNDIAGDDILSPVNLTLPLGISFYTFQVVSYVADVYMRRYHPDRNLLSFATYVCMFPQLIAGPIVNYYEVAEKLRNRKVRYIELEWGVTLFIMGLSYKVLLANKIASLWNDVQTAGVYGIDTFTAWLGSWGFSMQIYFDFFGYSLMAIGLGHMMGFKLPGNFANPYESKSATTFWRRWHMTLGRWFREYVYIPLGGNRKGRLRTIFNLFVVWSLTGLWHGANWNFIFWGIFYFIILMLEKSFYLEKIENSKLLGHIYMLILIPISWTIFNITDLSDLGLYLAKMLFIPIKGTVDTSGVFMNFFGKYWWLLLICAICSTRLPMKLVKAARNTMTLKVILLVLFWFSVYQLLKGANNPFLYFRF